MKAEVKAEFGYRHAVKRIIIDPLVFQICTPRIERILLLFVYVIHRYPDRVVISQIFPFKKGWTIYDEK